MYGRLVFFVFFFFFFFFGSGAASNPSRGILANKRVLVKPWGNGCAADCVLPADGPYFAQETLGGVFSNATLFETPAADDLELVLSQRTVFWIALTVVALLSNNDAWQRLATFLLTASTAVMLIAKSVTIDTPAFGFAGNHAMANGPAAALIAFGVIILALSGGLKKPRFRAFSESDPMLNIAVVAFDAFAVTVCSNILLRFDHYASAFPEATRHALATTVGEGLSRFGAVVILAQVASRAVMYGAGTRHERSGIAAVTLVSAVFMSELSGLNRILGDDWYYVRTVLIVLLAVGIRRNENVSGPSLSLTPRNALFLVLTLNLFYHVQSGPQVVAVFWDKWLGSKALSFLTPAPLFYFSMQHFSALSFLASSWMVFVSGNVAATRTSLVSFVLLHAVWTLVFVVNANTYGLSTFGAAFIVVQSGAVVTLVVKALSDSLHGESIGSYLRSIFAWSYSPIKGGLYLQVIAQLLGALLMLVPKNVLGHHASWHTEEAVLARYGFGIALLLCAVSLYLTTRVADRGLARNLTLFALASNLYAVLAVPFAKQSPDVLPLLGNYALGRIVDTLVSLVLIGGQFATLYIDFHRGEHAEVQEEQPRTPRGGRRRKAE